MTSKSIGISSMKTTLLGNGLGVSFFENAPGPGDETGDS
jgi:hypothetical protein